MSAGGNKLVCSGFLILVWGEGRKNNPVLRIKDDLNGLVLEETGGPQKMYNL